MAVSIRAVRLVGLTGVFTLCLFATPAFAQAEDEQLWLQVNTNVPVSDGVRVTVEQIARFSDRQDGLYQTEFGGLLAVRIAKGVDLGIGYRRVDTFNGNTAPGENRLRQQITFNRGAISARLRVDERFNPLGREVGIRIRPLLRYSFKLADKMPKLFVSNESFFLPNNTTWGQRAGFERMRNMAGVTLPIGRALSLDVAYLNQYRFGRGGSRPQMDHALNLQLTINLGSLRLPSEPD
jgi:Protein of unknown function (DUF2490)